MHVQLLDSKATTLPFLAQSTSNVKERCMQAKHLLQIFGAKNRLIPVGMKKIRVSFCCKTTSIKKSYWLHLTVCKQAL